MQINQQDIRAAVHAFLGLLEHGNGNELENIHALELALDRLALAYHFADDEFEEGQPDPAVPAYDHWRQLAVARFPQFGLYNLPSNVTAQIMEAEMQVGDALDDAADIAHDLSEVAWCWEHTTAKDALWHFRFGYEQHWGEHLRYLQLYLYALRSQS